MWSWLSGTSGNAESDPASNTSVIDDSKVEKKKYNRISRSWVETSSITRGGENNLEKKSAQHNLLNVDNASIDQDYPGVSSSFLSASRSTRRFDSFLEPKRISSRPIYIVRQSDSDILRFKEEHFEKTKRRNKGKFISIPILPADEMNSFTTEIKLWHRNRKNYKITLAFAAICGLFIFGVNFSFTVLWYANGNLLFFHTEHYTRSHTQLYNLHMNAQVVNLMLMAVGLNIFRLLPQTKLTKVIFYHTLILFVGIAVSLFGLAQAILSHGAFLKIQDISHTHFYSVHSWIGAITYFLYLYSFFSGFFLLYYPSSKMRLLHARFAIWSFMMCGAAAVAGFFYRSVLQLGTAYTHISIPGVIINAVGLLTVLFCILVRVAAASFVYRRRPKPQWDVIVYRSLEAIEDVYLELHDMYDSFEMWVKQVNQARLKAIRIQHSSIRSSLAESVRSAPKSDEII